MNDRINPLKNDFLNETKYSWVKTHQGIVEYLRINQNNQEGLIAFLDDIGITPLKDKESESDDYTAKLKEIDPFTFFCYLYKYGSARRLSILQKVAKKLDVNYPMDTDGVPSANAQKVWLFPAQYLRVNNEIAILWQLFFEALDKEVLESTFQDALNIHNVGKTKLTEALFYINPKRYFPINGPTKPYLKDVLGLNSKFHSFTEYNEILKSIKSKTDKPFYQLSHEAWQWQDNNSESNFFKLIKKFDSDKYEQYIEILREFVSKNNLKPTDERISLNIRPKKNLIAFIIGSRYSLLLDARNGKTMFLFASKEKTDDNAAVFSDADDDEKIYLNKISSIEGFKPVILQGLQAELNRNYKCPYRNIFNQDFANEVFQNLINETPNYYMRQKNVKSINQILYGPPGTGKTYQLKENYFSKYTLKEASITKEAFFEETVRDLTWWQVIALALLEMGISRVGDILNNRWVSEKARLSESKNVRATLWGSLQMHTVHESTTVAYTQRQVPLIFDKNEDKSWRLLENELREQFPELYDILESVNNFKSNPQKEIKHYVFTTFHQSFSYEDFIEGIKPKLNSEAENNELSYQIQNGVFKELCLRAQSDPENRYAIFIDEINRGNVSAIFGELITLIEADKRVGAKNEIKVRLPYSKIDFGVPMNVDIYGTMNTADRSVEALDTALRRRFSFKEIMPNPLLLENIIYDGFNLKEVLQTINERIEFLLDRDHTIGHAYFMDLESGDTEGLEEIFKNKVIPLLQEYFYHDYEKIALILGSGFVEVKTNHVIKFPKFEGITDPDSVTLCELITDIDDIEKAVITLLNRNEE